MKGLIEKLLEGVPTSGGLLKAGLGKGRFAEEINLTLYLEGKPILYAKLFLGR